MRIETRVIATGRDDHGIWINVAQNIAHPQGGGQPADKVRINDHPATVRRDRSATDENGTRLYCPALAEGTDTVVVEIDTAARLEHAALHTSGHLLHFVLQGFGWKATKGHHFPGEARVEFEAVSGAASPPWDDIADDVDAQSRALIFEALAVTAWQDGELRQTRIGETENIACAGTHVSDLGQIDDFALLGAKIKKGVLKISYRAAHRGI